MPDRKSGTVGSHYGKHVLLSFSPFCYIGKVTTLWTTGLEADLGAVEK